MKPNIKGLGLLVSDKKIFKSFTNRSLYIHKKGEVQHKKVFIFSNFIGPIYPMLHTNPQALWPFGSKKKIFKGFLP